MKRQVAKRTRKPLKKRVEDVRRRLEGRVEHVADRCMDVVDANLDRWVDVGIAALLQKVGLTPPERIEVKDPKKQGEVIVLQKQKDGSYA